MEKKMIDTEEGLMTWCRSTGSPVRMQRTGAKIILDYVSGHGRMLSAGPDGALFMNNEHMTEKTTLDDVVDLVCEWNYEALSDTRERKDNPEDFLDYCRSCTLEKTLEEHKFILDRIFKQTVYGRDVQAIAHKMALEMMKEMKLVPIYNIPIADEIGVFNKVSEKASYHAEERGRMETEGQSDMEPEVDQERKADLKPEVNMERGTNLKPEADLESEADLEQGTDMQQEEDLIPEKDLENILREENDNVPAGDMKLDREPVKEAGLERMDPAVKVEQEETEKIRHSGAGEEKKAEKGRSR